MAAILEPHRFPRSNPAVRPQLRLIQGGAGRRTAGRPPVTALVLVGALALLLVFGAVAVGRGALAGLAPAPAASSGAPASSSATRSVVAEPGDTLWSIARELQPEGDVRPLVDRLVAGNGGTVIAPGDRIALPS